MLKIYGRKNSVNVMKVLWVCDEIGLPYEHDAEVGGKFGRNRDAEYLAKNPNGLVPTIDDDGFILWESDSIVRYLAAKHDSPLYPRDPRARADVERWMDWRLSVLGGQFGGAFGPLYLQLIRTPPEKRDHALITMVRQRADAAFALLDNHLADRDFLGGKQLSIGDISIGPFAHRWLALPLDHRPLPNLTRYRDRLAERPGYRQHVMLPLD
jgi:glutathione S-transferase